jgi:hypothetical protein
VNRFSSRTYNASVTGETSQRLDASQVILVENGWLGDLLIGMGVDVTEVTDVTGLDIAVVADGAGGGVDGAGGGVTGGSELRREEGEGPSGAEGVAVAAGVDWGGSGEETALGVVCDSIAGMGAGDGWFRAEG